MYDGRDDFEALGWLMTVVFVVGAIVGSAITMLLT